MNRPIKFRAWQREEDEYYSRMISSSQSIVTAFRHVIGEAAPSGFSDCDNQPDKNRYVLMQSTGLKDKNGVEIFEGDIVRVETQIEDDGSNPIGYVTWNTSEPEMFIALPEQFKEEGNRNYHLESLYEPYSEYFEVIGNIYEHPELLEGDPHAES